MLTVTAINKAKPAIKPYKLSDEKGMYLYVAPTGGQLWRFDYRFIGVRKTLALGAYPDISLLEARDKRDKARNLLANEIDPSAAKKAIKANKQKLLSDCFESITREWIAIKLKNKITHALAEFIILDRRPFEIVNGAGFQSFVECALGVGRNLLELYAISASDLSDYLLKSKTIVIRSFSKITVTDRN